MGLRELHHPPAAPLAISHCLASLVLRRHGALSHQGSEALDRGVLDVTRWEGPVARRSLEVHQHWRALLLWVRLLREHESSDWRRAWMVSGLDRAHVVGIAEGGSDGISNLVLLCGRCHREHPKTHLARETF